MASTTDVLVVGGGVIGTSIAFHLARLRAGRVTLVERDGLASGASGRSGALVRTHYTTEAEARLAWAAVPWFEEWADRVGGDCGFVRTGFAQLVEPEDRELLRANVAMLRRIGVDTRLVDADELRALHPDLAVTDDEVAAYEPRSGYADPVAVAEGFAAAATRLGADVRTGTPATALAVDGDRVVGVDTPAGRVTAGTVVLANGAWSVPLLATAGVDAPIETYRAQAAIVTRPPSLLGRAGHPILIDRRHGIYTRPAGDDETLVGLSQSSAPAATLDATEVDAGFPEHALRQLAEALPPFRASTVRRSQAGPLDVTPDRCCLLGPVEQLAGLVLAVGMSGSGFKKSPAIGACIAELVVEGEASTAPIAPFSPDRYARSAPIVRTDYRVGTGPDGSRDSLVH